jgi:hypothetical protein
MCMVSGRSFRHIGLDCQSSIQRTFPDHVPLYLVTAAYVVVAGCLTAFYGLPLPFGSAVFFLFTIVEVAALVGGIAALRYLWEIFRQKPSEPPLSLLAQKTLTSFLVGDRFGNIVHGLAAFTPLMVVFAALKPDIARINPFSWDQQLMQAGVVLGFGRHFWQILQPLFGHPAITTVLSFGYGAWFFVMFGCLFSQLISPKRDHVRMQFLLAFAFAWFVGGFVIATIFSSAGPCFYGHVVSGPNPYAPLLAYLDEASRHWPIWTVQIQKDLWHSYLMGSGDLEGISAMPSMHVTIAVLVALFGWQRSPRLGVAFTSFAALVFIASILLGWHYVADCIVGAVLAVVFWRMADISLGAWTRFMARRQVIAVAVGNAVAEG